MTPMILTLESLSSEFSYITTIFLTHDLGGEKNSIGLKTHKVCGFLWSINRTLEQATREDVFREERKIESMGNPRLTELVVSSKDDSPWRKEQTSKLFVGLNLSVGVVSATRRAVLGSHGSTPGFVFHLHNHLWTWLLHRLDPEDHTTSRESIFLHNKNN